MEPSSDTQTYRERLAAPGAAAHVACVWIQSVGASASAYVHRTVPNGCVELAYRLGADEISVIGPRRDAAVELVEPGATVIGVRFHPGAPAEALGCPASELLGRTVELADLWGKPAAVLADRLAEAQAPTAAADLLEREVAERVNGRRRDPVAAATLDLLHRKRKIEPRRIAADLFLSDRQLRRRCQAAFGYGAKTMQRIIRFQRFLALSWNAGHAPPGLARLALAAGYADQPHLTRECVELTGLTPSRFLAETKRSCGPNHDHAPTFAPLLASAQGR
jgi:AraC-like DNA-binding protein